MPPYVITCVRHCSHQSIRLSLNFATNLGEVVDTVVREVKELSPLVIGSAAGFAFGLEELEDERAASADVVAAREKVSADESFEDAGLAAALAPDDGDLRELDRGLAPELGEDVLELVDDGDHGGA